MTAIKKIYLSGSGLLVILTLTGCGNSHCVRYEDRTEPVYVCTKVNTNGSCGSHAIVSKTQSVCVERICDRGYIQNDKGECVEDYVQAPNVMTDYPASNTKTDVIIKPEALIPVVTMKPESAESVAAVKSESESAEGGVKHEDFSLPVFRPYINKNYGDWNVRTVYSNGVYYGLASTVHASERKLVVLCAENTLLCNAYYEDLSECSVDTYFPVIVSSPVIKRSNVKAICINTETGTVLKLPDNYVDSFTRSGNLSIDYTVPGGLTGITHSTTFSLKGSAKAIDKAKEIVGLQIKSGIKDE